MSIQEYIDFVKNIKGAKVDYPFKEGEKMPVFRHTDNNKWFGIIMTVNNKTFVNLKGVPLDNDFLSKRYEGITPAYHMNKVHWISVYFDSDVPIKLTKELTLLSFDLTADKKKSK